ncbi:ATP-binding cassette domain-containing protein [Mycoplasma putrefaciens]|uniref:Oligopeptide ABC transporter, ATP-binding protein n=1 Tax=Mycoplasma putrefaciens (strain ATCC 15718 / NCTC 10155 / C30 KS-1 / KS-1) TaxID=743965 RepID=A0A7U4E9Y6_MYCPK|nr:ATP-binding cassette domain-containing protein [Mycoplasma putrefaciens]AEM68985.1 Oligopeptide ABC transporter, ATP-binding protein [Mycoplasma putrefaciens KS1]
MIKDKEKIIRVRDLLIQFGSGKNKVKAVKGVSFDIYKGETFGLVGESGSGKTTIGRAIMGIQPVTDGAIFFENKLLRGKAPNVYAINQKIFRHLDAMKQNQLTTSLCLNDYLNEFKRIFYKYTQSKFYNFKTKQLEDYPDNVSRTIVEGTNLKDTKLVSIKKNVNLWIVFEAINDNLKRMLKIIRLQDKLSKFLATVFEYIDTSKELSTSIKQYQKIVSDIMFEIKQHENQIYIILQEMTEIRTKVEKGYHTSISKFFDDLGVRLKKVIALQKQISVLIEKAKKAQIINVALTAPKQKQLIISRQLDAVKNETWLVKDFQKLVEIIQENNFYKALQAGEIFQQPTKQAIKENKKDIQMIFQDPSSSLNERMAVEEIIQEGLDNFPELYRNDQVRKAYIKWFNQNNTQQQLDENSQIKESDIKRYLITELLKTVGMLPEHLSRYPHEFSGGQRQRIGIARTLIMKPKFVVADEPISALDVSIRAQIMNLLSKFQKDFDLTYIFIAHDLSVVRFTTNRIAVIYRGDIVELAESDELFECPLHPYTKSLLSAIPLPDPIKERNKVHFEYKPDEQHYDYLIDFPKWREIKNGHYIYANDREFKNYQIQLDKYYKSKKTR